RAASIEASPPGRGFPAGATKARCFPPAPDEVDRDDAPTSPHRSFEAKPAMTESKTQQQTRRGQQGVRATAELRTVREPVPVPRAPGQFRWKTESHECAGVAARRAQMTRFHASSSHDLQRLLYRARVLDLRRRHPPTKA